MRCESICWKWSDVMQRELILSKLTMEQVLQFYAPRKTHHHRCGCPLHNGKDDNFVIYHDSFYCWVCGAGGDFIKFVSTLFNISYPEAMKRIDADFALGVYEKPTLTQFRKNKKQIQEYQKRNEEKQRQREERFEAYLFYLRNYSKYKEWIEKYEPKEDDQELHPNFAEAIKGLPYINYLIDEYDWKG